jgi:transcriptional regulator with XRE-family HTH domain
MDFGEKLALLLKEKGLSQAKFAREMEVNSVSVNQYIKGTRTPPVEFIQKVIDYFPEVDLNWLLREESNTTMMLQDAQAVYNVPITPATLIESIEKNLKELKAQLSQK